MATAGRARCWPCLRVGGGWRLRGGRSGWWLEQLEQEAAWLLVGAFAAEGGVELLLLVGERVVYVA
jgi:hypothetical protein